MKKSLLIICTCFFTSMIYCQNLSTNEINKKEVNKLSFITGSWSGRGWMMGQDGKKHSFTQTENIYFKLDSTAIVIEGKGMDSGKVIHNALAIITYNPADNNYNFHSYLSNGMEGKFKAELKENKMYWYPMENIRYIISLNEKGQWYETGEMNRGEQWFQFFEMTLAKMIN